MVLLNKLGIRNRLVSNHKFNEHGKAKWFVQEMLSGKSVAVITDAGTPCISDPGNELIRAAVDAGIRVVGIPGCCAAVNALSVSGFDLRSFCFLGFFPRENAERLRLLDTMRRDQITSVFVFYESPLRIMEMIDFLIRESASCSLCVMNDMTKLHEMSFRGSPSHVKEQLLAKGNYEKGEYSVVLSLDEDYRYRREQKLVSAEALLVDAMVRGADSRQALQEVLSDRNNTFSKNELKAAAIRLKSLFEA
jgi:16S rRNA (cytidine1402-2'-O)-methyltransferase